MAGIASAYVNIVPKFEGFTSAIQDAVAKAMGSGGTAPGTRFGNGFASGAGAAIAKSGAVMGAVMALTNQATSMVSSSMGAAISRFDVLNRYPRVMESLGYSSEAASESIQLMSDRLQGLPTALDTMASTVQGLTAITGDMDQATRLGLALNDMLIAGGSSTQMTTAALEQFRQIMSKGKPELQDWRTLIQAMPGQMDQLAKSMLGPTANANDLYQAIGGGDQSAYDGPKIAMDDFIAKIIELDEVGGEGITSFAEQAKQGSSGIQTAMANMQTAVTRGLAGTLEQLGEGRITGWIDGLKAGISGAFDTFNSGFADVVPHMDGLAQAVGGFADEFGQQFAAIMPQAAEVAGGVLDVFSGMVTGMTPYISGVAGVVSGILDVASGIIAFLEPIAPAVGSAVASFTLFNGVGGILMGVASNVVGIVSALGKVAGGASLAGSGILAALGVSSGPALAIAGISAVLALVVGGFVDAERKAQDFAKATKGMEATIAQAQGLKGYKSQLDAVGQSAEDAWLKLDKLNEANAARVDAISDILSSAKEDIGDLSAAWSVIEQYAGKTEISAEAAGQVAWAAEKVSEATGLQVSAADVAAGIYRDEQGAAHDLVEELGRLVEAKRYARELDALYETMDQQRSAVEQSASAMAHWQDVYDSAYQKEYAAQWESGATAAQANAHAVNVATDAANSAVGDYDRLAESLRENKRALNETEKEAGKLAGTIDGTADAWTQAIARMSRSTNADMVEAANSFHDSWNLEDLMYTLRDYGVSVEDAQSMTAQQLAAMAGHYDGTIGSIINDVDSMGWALDESAQNQYVVIDALKAKLEGLGAGTQAALDAAGVSTYDFAAALQQAGVGTEQLAAVGGANISDMAARFDGDIGLMVTAIQGYNGQELFDKDGNLTINDVQLQSANGEILTWNGTELKNQDGTAAAEYTEVVLANGELAIWNGYVLVPQRAFAGADYSQVTSGIKTMDKFKTYDGMRVSTTASANTGAARSVIDNYKRLLDSIPRTISTRITQTVTKLTITQMSGSAVEHAAGGIRRHAGGAIVDAPGSGVPLDIVGEDGGEAIIPLTNRQYVKPFARTVAEEMAQVMGADHGDKTLNIYIDGMRMNDTEGMRRASMSFMNELLRRGGAYA